MQIPSIGNENDYFITSEAIIDLTHITTLLILFITYDERLKKSVIFLIL